MIKELAIERYRFLCPNPRCEHEWTAEYDVQHIADSHGNVWEYYSLNEIPVLPPTAVDAVRCPRCGASRVWVDLLASRNIPLATQLTDAEAADQPRQISDPQQRETRRNAPLLSGTQAHDPPAEHRAADIAESRAAPVGGSAATQ